MKLCKLVDWFWSSRDEVKKWENFTTTTPTTILSDFNQKSSTHAYIIMPPSRVRRLLLTLIGQFARKEDKRDI